MSICVMEIGAWSLQNNFDFDSGFHDVQCKHFYDCENCYLLEAYFDFFYFLTDYRSNYTILFVFANMHMYCMHMHACMYALLVLCKR